MKKGLIVSTLLIFTVVSAFQCRKENDDSDGLLKGVLVFDYCGQIAVRITEGDFDPSRVVASWDDPGTTNTYKNIFTVANYCDVQGKLTPGQQISFRFAGPRPLKGCIICYGYRATPDKSNHIKILD